MRKELRQAIDAYFAQLATLNGVANVTQRFNVVPRVQQTLETKMQESSDFLSRINIIGVTEQIGDKVDLLEIDVPGMLWKVGGTDVYASIRLAIGLALPA